MDHTPKMEQNAIKWIKNKMDKIPIMDFKMIIMDQTPQEVTAKN